jgi:hypothetical protein
VAATFGADCLGDDWAFTCVAPNVPARATALMKAQIRLFMLHPPGCFTV